MGKVITLYHGSKDIIENPTWGKGRKNNDFGLGFYCTENEELAKEWATLSSSNGFSNKYSLDPEFLHILNLNSSHYSILNWIAILLEHRWFLTKLPIAEQAKRYLIDNFYINVNAYDVIIGYRADDSYFDYASTFLNNGISVSQLAKAMKLGALGEQVVIKSQYAFSLLKYEGCSNVDYKIFNERRTRRMADANAQFLKIASEFSDDLYIRDIIKENIGNDDPCIR